MTIVVALAMLRMGLRRNLLAVRSTTRRCASCRRRIETPYCPHCTR
jgi:recombinational DNA repair protein RecR